MDISKAANIVSQKLDADILFYNGDMERPYDQTVLDQCLARSRKKNIVLILVTGGGDAHAAYRIARCLQSQYENFTCYVPGYCKSAGTLLVLGAHDIIFSEHGELGPLDVQMRKKDDLFQLQSGHTVMDALTALQNKAYLSFEETLLSIEKSSEGIITIETAAEMASKLAVGLFSPLFGQIDPLHIGEAARALSIANAYGARLCSSSGNWDRGTLNKLLSGYPSHGFVIDRIEAETLFSNIRLPDDDESALAKLLQDAARTPTNRAQPVIEFLSEERKAEASTDIVDAKVVPIGQICEGAGQ
ncbi:MAG TPA: ATP-dependent Clp protease proteolytic subunit [Candidatus Acidoferrum sp.]|nr:ATP-dependent Clp protease proteolytic subunit [Candidatus Acidoferrum sp.]